MEVCPDYEELLAILNEFRVKYLVIGAHAVIFHTEPRYTKDFDVWIPPALNDSQRVYAALAAFGAPLKNLTPETFQDPDVMFQIGVEPVRIDILVHMQGVSPRAAWQRREKSVYGATPMAVLSRDDTIRAKRAAGRPKDLIDIDKIEKFAKRRARKKSPK